MQLHVIDSGKDDRGEGVSHDTPPLVILHGLFGSADNWRSHIKQWQRSRRVVALDLRNHGRSGHQAGMQYEALAEDVMETLTPLNLGRFDLLGHSMGGKVAMTVARQHGEQLSHLVVADISPVSYGHGHDEIFAAMRAVERAEPGSRKAADDIMQEAIETAATRQFLATNLVRDDDGIMRWRVGLDEISDGYPSIIAPPGGEGAFTGKALLLRGETSSYVRQSHREAIEAVMPNVRLETIEGAGHWLHAEQPKAFRDAVNRFLDET